MGAKKLPADGSNSSERHKNADKYEPIEQHYRLGQQLGKGSFGTVYRGVPIDPAKGTDGVAVKSIRRGELFDEYKAGQAAMGQGRVHKKEYRKELEREIELLGQIEHPGMVRMLDTPYNDKEAGITHLVLDLCEGPELEKVISTRGALSEDEARPLMLQLLTVVKYLHSVRVVHRDIKPANAMFVAPLPDGPISVSSRIKLLDFGIAERVGARRKGKKKWHEQDWRTVKENEIVSFDNKGTPGYKAPELKGQAIEIQVRHALLVDNYMLGVVLREVLTGIGPQVFVSHGFGVLMGSCCGGGGGGHEVHTLSSCSSQVADLLAKLLAPNEQRISAAQACEHAWFEGGTSEVAAPSHA